MWNTVECPYCEHENDMTDGTIDLPSDNRFDHECEGCNQEFEVLVEFSPDYSASKIEYINCEKCERETRDFAKRGRIFPFPESLDGDEYCMSCFFKGHHKDDLEKYTEPWNRERFKRAIVSLLDEGFQRKKNRHSVYYFSSMNVTMVWEGHHSVGVGIGMKEGTIQAKKIAVDQLYDHVHTDGFYWINTHTNEKYDHKVFDFRFALVYELSKIRYKISQEK